MLEKPPEEFRYCNIAESYKQLQPGRNATKKLDCNLFFLQEWHSLQSLFSKSMYGCSLILNSLQALRITSILLNAYHFQVHPNHSPLYEKLNS